MELLSGAEMVVRSLRDEGVKYIYGYPGGALLHVYDALFKEPELTHILVRHEQAATHMADAYGRATGKAGVVLVTSGPGATNAVTGIATAYNGLHSYGRYCWPSSKRYGRNRCVPRNRYDWYFAPHRKAQLYC